MGRGRVVEVVYVLWWWWGLVRVLFYEDEGGGEKGWVWGFGWGSGWVRSCVNEGRGRVVEEEASRAYLLVEGELG